MHFIRPHSPNRVVCVTYCGRRVIITADPQAADTARGAAASVQYPCLYFPTPLTTATSAASESAAVAAAAQPRRLCYQLKARMRLPIRPPDQRWSYLAPLQRYCRFLCSWPLPYSTLIFGVFPLDQIAHVGVSPSRNLKLISCEIIFEVGLFQPVWKIYLNVTDRGTDRQTDGRTDKFNVVLSWI